MADGKQQCIKVEFDESEANKDICVKEETQSEGEDYLPLQYGCPICHRKFNSCEDVEDHVKTHENDRENNISNNNITETSIKVEPADPEPDTPSQQSDASDDSYRNNSKFKKLKQKKVRKPRPRTLSCDVCDYVTNHWGNLRTHKRQHTGEKPYSCEKCDYKSAQLVHLKEHMYVHLEVAVELPCPKCEQVFNRPHTLRRHLRRHKTERYFSCRYCQFKALGQTNLRIHMKEHSSSLQCPECNHIAKGAAKLKRHMVAIHTNNKAYKCQYCDYRTPNSNHLKTHIRVHTKEKPYKCDFCGYACTQKNHLISHLRSHSGEKPYGCEFCSYTSTQATHVKAHRRIHTGERPFKCTECDYATKTASEVRKHKLRHHPKDGDPIKPLITCDLCKEYTCKLPKQLRRHIARKHEDISKDNNIEIKRRRKSKPSRISPSLSIESNTSLTILPIEVECPVPNIKTEIVEADNDLC